MGLNFRVPFVPRAPTVPVRYVSVKLLRAAAQAVPGRLMAGVRCCVFVGCGFRVLHSRSELLLGMCLVSESLKYGFGRETE